jgi:hypothetical protein
LVIGVQRGGHASKARHEAIDRRPSPISAFEKPLDFITRANCKAAVTTLDQECFADKQAIIREGEPEIVWSSFAQTPLLAHGFFLVFGFGRGKVQSRRLRQDGEAAFDGLGAKGKRNGSDDELRHRERKRSDPAFTLRAGLLRR